MEISPTFTPAVEEFYRTIMTNTPPNIGQRNSDRNALWFFKRRTIKAAKPRNYQDGGVIRDYVIGMDLMSKGIHVHARYGLGTWNDNLPFFVMERVDLTPFSELSREEYQSALKSLREQLKKVDELGYVPFECSVYHNTGFCRSQGATYLYDFEFWERR